MPGIVAPDRVLRGRYRLTRELHRGALAAVWEARDCVLDRPVAVRVLDPAAALDDAVVGRFRRQAVAGAGLAHPNIVTTYDTGPDDETGVDFVVMELVAGGSLRDTLDGPGLSTGRAFDIAAQVADALAYAHGRDVVHGNLDPSNILLRPDGRVKVGEFCCGPPGLERTRLRGFEAATPRNGEPSVSSAAPDDGGDDTVEDPVAGQLADISAVIRLLHTMLGSVALPEPVALVAGGPEPDAGALAAAIRACHPVDATPAHGLAPLGIMTATGAPPLVAGVVDDGGDTAVARSRSRARSRPPVVITLAAGIAIALVALFALHPSLPAIGPARARATTTIALTRAADFDPFGGREHPELAAAAIDGNPKTAWTTERYRTPTFGVKPGVGIWVELSRSASIRQIELDTSGGDWSGQIFVAQSPGADLAAWGTPAATITATQPHTTTALTSPVTGRYVLVWVTRLPPALYLTLDEVRVGG